MNGENLDVSSLDEQLKVLQTLDQFEYEVLMRIDNSIKDIHRRVEWMTVTVWILAVAIMLLTIAYAFSL